MVGLDVLSIGSRLYAVKLNRAVDMTRRSNGETCSAWEKERDIGVNSLDKRKRDRMMFSGRMNESLS